jgi:hypothetical protein
MSVVSDHPFSHAGCGRQDRFDVRGNAINTATDSDAPTDSSSLRGFIGSVLPPLPAAPKATRRAASSAPVESPSGYAIRGAATGRGVAAAGRA